MPPILLPLIAALLFILSGAIAAGVHAQTPSPSASTGSIANVATPAPKVALPVVAPVDLQRYSGDWYEQARLPNRFQRKCAGQVSAHYGVLPQGRVEVINRCTQSDGSLEEASGVGRLVPVEGQPQAGRLKVSFAPVWTQWLPLVWGDYWILQLDDKYEVSLVGTPDRKYLWVLSRAPRLEETRLKAALDYAQGLGFDTQAVVRTPAAPALAAR